MFIMLLRDGPQSWAPKHMTHILNNNELNMNELNVNANKKEARRGCLSAVVSLFLFSD